MCVNVLSFISPVRAIRGSDLFKEAIKTYLFKKAFACDTQSLFQHDYSCFLVLDLVLNFNLYFIRILILKCHFYVSYQFFRLLLNLGLCYIILLVHFIVCMYVRYKCKAHLIKHINILICAKQAINIIFIIIYCPTSVSCKEANCGLRHQIAATAVTVLLELSKTMV